MPIVDKAPIKIEDKDAAAISDTVLSTINRFSQSLPPKSPEGQDGLATLNRIEQSDPETYLLVTRFLSGLVATGNKWRGVTRAALSESHSQLRNFESYDRLNAYDRDGYDLSVLREAIGKYRARSSNILAEFQTDHQTKFEDMCLNMLTYVFQSPEDNPEDYPFLNQPPNSEIVATVNGLLAEIIDSSRSDILHQMILTSSKDIISDARIRFDSGDETSSKRDQLLSVIDSNIESTGQVPDFKIKVVKMESWPQAGTADGASEMDLWTRVNISL